MNEKGVSVLLGFILLMLIGMLFLSVIQTHYVPSVLKDYELKHMDTITSEVFEMDKAVSSGEISSVVFDLGVDYPKYLFLLTPQTLASSVSAEEFRIVVRGESDEIGQFPPIENTSKRIVLKLNYFVNPDYEIVYENTAVFKAFESVKLVSGEQKMFGKDYVNVYIINTSFNSLSSNQPISLTFIPISVPDNVGGINVRVATIEFETIYPEYWKETLKALNSSVDYIVNYSINGNNVIVNVTNVTLRFYYIYVTSGVGTSVEQAYEYLKGISLSPSYMVKTTYVNVDPITVNQGQSVVLGVRVLDQYFNPLENVELSVSVDGANANTLYTNDKGEAYYIYTSPQSSGTHTVKIYCTENPAVYVIYNISVQESAGAPCPYNLSWNVYHYDWNVSSEGNTKTFYIKASYGNDPLIDASIDLSKNSTIVDIPSSVTTDENGNASVDIIAKDNGSVAVTALYGCAYDILTLHIYGFGINKPPVAKFTYSPSYPAVGEVVTFDASSSYDPDGTIVEYRWDFGDGNVITTTTPTVTHTYSSWGPYKVTLTVVDNSSLANSTSVWIWVGDLVYNGDAIAVDGDDNPRPDRNGGVEFTITNRFNTSVEIDWVNISCENPSIVYLSDALYPNDLPGYCEVYVEANVSSYVDYYGGTDLPVYVDLGVSGDENSGTNAILDSNATAKIYLYEFYNDRGQNADMSRETLIIEVGYIVDGETKTKTFTITPQ